MEGQTTRLSVENAESKLFYGFIVAAAGFLIMAIMWGAMYSFGVFLKSLTADFGWTRAMTSGSVSLFMLVLGLLGMVTGKLNDRFGPRIVVTVCSLFLGAGFLMVSQIVELWQLYLIYGGILAAGVSGGMVPLTSTIARWFVRRRGLMTGIVLSGVGAGVMVGPPLAGWLISTYDWRTSYLVIGIVAGVLLVIIAQFLRRDPSKVGQLPDGESILKQEEAVSSALGFSTKEAMHTRQFWTLFSINMIWGIILIAILVHVVPHATDLGINAISAASILAVVGGVHIVGRIWLCSLSDRIGNKRALIIGYSILTVSLLSLLVVKDLWAFYLFAVIFGVSYGGLGALPPLMVAELFGMRTHGTTLGIIVFAWSLGGVIGPFVTGYIFDITNGYSMAFLFGALLSAAGLVLTVSLRPVTRRV